MAEMTVYCTKDDVQRWVKRVQFTDATKVTPSDVDSYIAAVSNVVDGILRTLGVTLPVPSTSKAAMEILKLLVSFEAASYAEQAANFGANKNESTHGKWLHDKYVELRDQIIANPGMLLLLVTDSVGVMRSSTEDMIEGAAKEGDEIFTAKHIKDFKTDHKILSPSELDSPDGTITGLPSRTKI